MNNTLSGVPSSALRINEAITHLKDRLAGANVADVAMTLSPSNRKDIALVVNLVEDQMIEIRNIDHLLSRRAALDDIPTRLQKIERAIQVAAESDRKDVVIRNLHEMIRGVKRIVNTFQENGEIRQPATERTILAAIRHLTEYIKTNPDDPRNVETRILLDNFVLERIE